MIDDIVSTLENLSKAFDIIKLFLTNNSSLVWTHILQGELKMLWLNQSLLPSVMGCSRGLFPVHYYLHIYADDKI